MNSKWIKDLKTWNTDFTTGKKKKGKTLEDTSIRNYFLNRTPTAQEIRARINKLKSFCTSKETAGCRWLMPTILVTEKAEIRRISVWSQPGQKVLKTLSWKYPSQKRGGYSPCLYVKKKRGGRGGVAQSKGPEFQYHKKRKKWNSEQNQETTHRMEESLLQLFNR
jgi:hypothetical protein